MTEQLSAVSATPPSFVASTNPKKFDSVATVCSVAPTALPFLRNNNYEEINYEQDRDNNLVIASGLLWWGESQGGIKLLLLSTKWDGISRELEHLRIK